MSSIIFVITTAASGFWALSWPMKLAGTAAVAYILFLDPLTGTYVLMTCGALGVAAIGMREEGVVIDAILKTKGWTYSMLFGNFGNRRPPLDMKAQWELHQQFIKAHRNIPQPMFSVDEAEQAWFEIFENFLNNLPWDNYYFLSFLMVLVFAICFILYRVVLSLKKEK